MKLILLGTGTSTGVPEVACGCMVCQSTDPKDKRLRTSALVITSKGKRVLIDCGPDFRQQANHIGLDRLDAVLLTHEHYDHAYGLDDVRTLAWSKNLPIYGQKHVLEAVRKRMHYAFGKTPYPGTPRLQLCELLPNQSVDIVGLEVLPVVVKHGSLPIYAYRMRDCEYSEASLCYITDMKTIDTDQWALVEDCQLLVMNALRYKKQHPSHQSIKDVQVRVDSMFCKPMLTVLTHLSHHAPPHQDMERLLSQEIRPGYDYMCLTLRGDRIEEKAFNPGKPIYHYLDLDLLAHQFWCDGAWDIEAVFTYILEEQTTICCGSSIDEESLLCIVSFNQAEYPVNPEFYQIKVKQALLSLLSFYGSNSLEYSQCVHFYEQGMMSASVVIFTLAVNRPTFSLYTVSGSNQSIDMTVVKAQLTAVLSRYIKEIMAPQFKSSLENY